MKAKPYGEFLVLLIVLCLGLLLVIRFSIVVKEGFYDSSPEQDSYESLRANLQRTMEPYCKVANLVQQQMMQIYMTPKVTAPLPVPPPKPIAPPSLKVDGEASSSKAPKGWWGDSKPAARLELDPAVPPPSSSGASVTPTPGESQEAAWNHLLQTYSQVYNCTDGLAGSRPQCGGRVRVAHPDWKYLPCSAYLSIPSYNAADTGPMITALMNIPSNTPEKLVMEIAWYGSIIKTLQDGIDAGNHPPEKMPENPTMPKEDGQDKAPDPPQPAPKPPAPPPGAAAAQNSLLAAHGYKPLGSEGFFDSGQCSPEAIALKRRRQMEQRQRQLESDADSCTIPDLPSEINRVNAILNNPTFQQAMSQCQAIYAAAMKLQSDIEKLKKGTLYDWQNTGSGAPKSYSKFKGGDRTAGFLASLSQNRDFTGN